MSAPPPDPVFSKAETASPDDVAMSAMGADEQPGVPMSFDSAAALLRQRVLDPPAHPGVLASLDRFKIERIVGMGGMGVVVQARHPVTNALVAIKLIRPEFVHDTEATHRFLIEARHMHNLSHPNIVRVMEVSDRARGPYYVMPFYPASLAQSIRPGVAMDRERIIDVASQMAQAVAYAHSRGVIHRDLKPANVLLDAEGHAYVSDFGLVRTVFNDSTLDVARNQCEGTAPYMSPAVAAGQAEDTRCDIYALGAMLYELLTGQRPYLGSTRSVVEQVIAGPPPGIREINPRADARLAQVAEGAMARNLRERYASADDIVADLKRVARNENPLGPRCKPLGATPLFKVGAGVALLLLCGLGAWWAWSRAVHKTISPAPGEASVVVPQPAPAQAPSPARAPQLTMDPHSPLLVNPPADFTQLGDHELARYHGHKGHAIGVTFTADQQHFISTGDDGTVRCVELATGNTNWIYQSSGPDLALQTPVVSPDAALVLVPEFAGDAVLLDVMTGQLRLRLLGHRSPVDVGAFTPDSHFAVTGSGHWEAAHAKDFTARLWDLTSGQEIRRFGQEVFQQRVTQAVVTPDGATLITGSADKLIRIWDLKTAALSAQLAGHEERITAVQLSQDGKILLTCDWLGQVRIWDLPSRQCRQTLQTTRDRTQFASLSPTADRFATGGTDGSIRFYSVSDGRFLRQVGAHSGDVMNAQWSQDSSTLLSAGIDGTIRRWSTPK